MTNMGSCQSTSQSFHMPFYCCLHIKTFMLVSSSHPRTVSWFMLFYSKLPSPFMLFYPRHQSAATSVLATRSPLTLDSGGKVQTKSWSFLERGLLLANPPKGGPPRRGPRKTNSGAARKRSSFFSGARLFARVPCPSRRRSRNARCRRRSRYWPGGRRGRPSASAALASASRRRSSGRRRRNRCPPGLTWRCPNAFLSEL